jgi:hypothetical protein
MSGKYVTLDGEFITASTGGEPVVAKAGPKIGVNRRANLTPVEG